MIENSNGNGDHAEQAWPKPPAWFEATLALESSEIRAYLTREDLSATEKRLVKSLMRAIDGGVALGNQAQLNGLATCCLLAKLKARKVHIPANVLETMPAGTKLNVNQGQYGDLHITMDIPEPRILRANKIPG